MSSVPAASIDSQVSAFARLGAERSAAVRNRAAQHRATQALALHVAGLSLAEIGRQLKVSRRTVYRDLANTADARVRVEEIISDVGVDVDDAWVRLSQCFDASLEDVFNDDWSLKPLSEWPEVWKTGLAGELKIEDIMVRSADGGESSWDVSDGKKVTLKRESLLKIIELAGRLKPVDAFVQQKAGDTNVVVITAEQQRGDRLKRAKARIVNVSATSIEDGPAGVDALRALPQAQGDEK